MLNTAKQQNIPDVLREDDFAHLLQNTTFVDYFNVFLSLPVFGQCMMYQISDCEFNFDPPIKKTKQRVNKVRLVQWLIEQRLPLFLNTDLYLEYTACCRLIDMPVRTTEASYSLDYDKIYQEEDMQFVQECIGNVVGMRHFLWSMKGTSGEVLFWFWLDVERLHRVTPSDADSQWRSMRDMQLKYYLDEKGLGAFEEQLKSLLKDGPTGLKGTILLNITIHDEPDQFTVLASQKAYNDILSKLVCVQGLAMEVLHKYWLHRYILKIKLKESKKTQKSDPELHKIRSKTDLEMLKTIRDIDKAIVMLDGNTTRMTTNRRRRAKHAWHAMFPSLDMEPVCLKGTDSSEEILTLQDDGSLLPDTLGDDMDQRLKEERAKKDKRRASKKSSASRRRAHDEKETRQKSKTKKERASKERDQPQNKVTPDSKTLDSAAPKQTRTMELPGVSTRPTPQGLPGKASRSPFTSTALPALASSMPGGSLNRLQSLNAKTPDSFIPQPELSVQPEQNVKFQGILRKFNSQRRDSLLQPREQTRELFTHAESPTSSTMDLLEEVRPTTPCSTAGLNTSLLNDLNRKCTKFSKILDTLEKQKMSSFHRTVSTDASGERPWSPLAEMAVWCGPSRPHVVTPEFMKPQLLDLTYRHENKEFLAAMATDPLASTPFLTHIQQMEQIDTPSKPCLLVAYRFWMNSQAYLNNCELASQERRKLLLTRKAMLMISDFLATDKHAVALIPAGLRASLRHLLPLGKCRDLLVCAQDGVSQVLHDAFEEYRRLDVENFLQGTIEARPKKSSNNHIQDKSAGTVAKAQRQTDSENLNYQAHAPIRKEGGRHWRAVQLAFLTSGLDISSLLVNSLKPNDLIYDADDIRGSLAEKKFISIYRQDVLTELERQKRIRIKRRQHRILEEARKHLGERTESTDDDIPSYMKAMRRKGQVVQRPVRPNSFLEVLRCETHMDFLKRFLIWHASETPLMFYLAVEDMKKSKDLKQRQNKMTTVLRRFFSETHGRGVESLECDADIVREIPCVEKVTFPMIVSAATCVARSLEAKWFTKYRDTFPEPSSIDSISTTSTLNEKEIVQRQWSKEKTKGLWMGFVRCVIRFRKVLQKPAQLRELEGFLRGEMYKEIEKQFARSNHGYSQGMAVKKIIRTKLVDVTKLVSDLHFVAEIDRFRNLCDDVARLAKTEGITHHEETLLETKAKLAIDCYLDCDFGQRIQVNTSKETVALILENFRAGCIDRGLFHAAYIDVIPSVIYLWRKYQNNRYANIFKATLPGIEGATDKQGKGKREIPNYLNLDIKTTKKIFTQGQDDDMSHLLFSLTNGLRWLMPTIKVKDTVRPRSGNDEEDDKQAQNFHLQLLQAQRMGRRNSMAPGGLGYGGRRTSMAHGSSGLSRRRSSQVGGHGFSLGGRRSSLMGAPLGGRRSSLASTGTVFSRYSLTGGSSNINVENLSRRRVSVSSSTGRRGSSASSNSSLLSIYSNGQRQSLTGGSSNINVENLSRRRVSVSSSTGRRGSSASSNSSLLSIYSNGQRQSMEVDSQDSLLSDRIDFDFGV